MCSSNVEKYMTWPLDLGKVCLVEYHSFYSSSLQNPKRRKHTCFIRYVWYNEQKYLDNLYKEKMMLFVTFRESENALKCNFHAWCDAYLSQKGSIDAIEKMSVSKTTATLGDTDVASKSITYIYPQIFAFEISLDQCLHSPTIEKYDIHKYLIHKSIFWKNWGSSIRAIESMKQPFSLRI